MCRIYYCDRCQQTTNNRLNENMNLNSTEGATQWRQISLRLLFCAVTTKIHSQKLLLLHTRTLFAFSCVSLEYLSREKQINSTKSLWIYCYMRNLLLRKNSMQTERTALIEYYSLKLRLKQISTCPMELGGNDQNSFLFFSHKNGANYCNVGADLALTGFMSRQCAYSIALY